MLEYTEIMMCPLNILKNIYYGQSLVDYLEPKFFNLMPTTSKKCIHLAL